MASRAAGLIYQNGLKLLSVFYKSISSAMKSLFQQMVQRINDFAEDSAKRAGEFLEPGFHAIKLKTDCRILIELRHVEAIRDIIGSEVKLLIAS